MSLPSIVGLTLNYRDAARTTQCTRSLLADGVSHVLVWDNSEDEGASTQALQHALGQEGRVTIVSSSVNLGFAAGVNRGLDWIELHFPCAWVLLINNDAQLRQGVTASLSAGLAGNHHAVVAYPSIDHAGRVLGTAYYQRVGGLFSARPLFGCFPYPSGCCLLIAPERAPRPFLDEDFFMYGEDVELGYRLGPESLMHMPEILVTHEGTASSGLGSPFYEIRMVAAHWILARKLAKGPIDFVFLFLGRLLTLPLRALLRAQRYRSLTPFKALHEGWRLAWGKDIQLQRARAAARLDQR